MNAKQQKHYYELKTIIENKNGKVLSDNYASSKVNFEFICVKGHYVKTLPPAIKRGKNTTCGCKKCANDVQKLTLEDIQNMATFNNGYLLSEVYINSTTKLKWKCKYGHEFMMTSNCVQQNHWCPECRKLSIDELREIAHSRNGRLLSTHYRNSKEKLEWQCSKEHKWIANANHIKQGEWCPYCCFDHIKLTIDEIRNLAIERGGKLLSNEYTNPRHLLLWECRNNHQWYARVDQIKYGKWCRYCHFETTRRPIALLHNVAYERGGKLLSTEYHNGREYVLWECKDKHQWWAKTDAIIQGTWCPICKISHGERAVEEYFKKFTITYTREYSIPYFRRKRYDFYFVLNNIHYLVEFDGQQHFHYDGYFNNKHERLQKRQKRDIIKTVIAWILGYRLIRIHYSQIKNIEYHIEKACRSNDIVYLSDPEHYKYISESTISLETLIEEAPEVYNLLHQ